MARNKKLKGMTGVDDPYELPENPELTINTADKTAGECVKIILNYLTGKKLITV